MATEKRLIDANAIENGIGVYVATNAYLNDTALDVLGKVAKWLDEAPTVDAVEVVHGRWMSDEGDILFHCSECETQISTSWDYDDLYWNYCPNCGAKMDGGVDNG